MLLVTTLSAFALDFTDYRKVSLSYFDPTESNDAKLSVTDNGDGTYNVTFNDIITKINGDTDNYGTFTFSNVSGSKSGDVTTVTGTNLTGTVSGGDYRIKEFTKGELSLKFKDGKAYATMSATCSLFSSNYTFDVVFGTDEGFGGGSTGGGETKEKYTVNFDKGAKSTHSGRVLKSFSLQQTGKDKQTESVSASRAAYEDHTSKVFTVEAGSEVTASFNYTGEWMNGYVYIDRDNDGEFSYKEGQWDQANTDLVAYSFYTTLANPKQNDGNGYNSTGANVTGNARNNVNPPVFTAPTEPGTYRIRFKVDWNCILPGGSSDILSDGGGVWDATLEVVAPAPTVDETFTYNQDAYVGTNNTNGTANVKVNKMTDGTYTMEITAPVATKVGVITVGTDAKGRTTYMGEVESSVVGGVKYVVNGVVYEEGGAKHLYMTLTNEDVTYTIGEDPDYVAPVTYKNTLYVVEKAKLLVETPDAEVVLQDKGDNKYDVTLPAFTADGKDVPSITFEATKADNKLTASTVTVNNVYNGEAAVVTMDGTFEADNKLFASLTVKCGELFDYEVGYGIKPFVATTKEYTAEWANVKVGDAEPVNFQNAKVDYTEFAKGQYSLTFKDLTFGEKKIGDFTIKYVSKDNMGQFSTTATAGEWTRVEADQDVASLGDKPSISGFEGVIGGTGDGKLFVKFTIAAYGTVAVDFGHKYEAPEPPVVPEVVDVVDADYNPAGQSWQKNDVSIDWDKQYIVAKLDLSTCKTGGAGPENVLAVGTDLTGWNNGPHYFFYYNKADKVLQYNYLHSANKSMNGGYANLSKAYIQLTDEVVTIELSKKGGLKVNGESALVKYIPSANSPSTNGTDSWTTTDLETVFSGLWNLSSIGFGGCQGSTMSNATYKYVKVVPLGWKETTEPETPEVTEKKTYNEKLYVVIGTTSTQPVDATVEVKEMSDKSINMSLKYSEYEYTSTDLKKGTDAKERTTYTGTISNGTQTFDVAGVVYQKDNVDRLYMTMTKESMKVVVGEDPDATPEAKPVVYKNTLKVVRGTDTKTYENAEVSVLAKGEGMYEVTLPKFSDMDNVPGEWGPITFQAKGVEESGKVVLTATDQEFTLTNTGWKNDVVKVSMKGEIESEMLKATFNVNHSSMSGYNYTLYYGVEAPEVVTEESNKTYKSNLRIADQTSEDENAYLFQTDEATVNIIKYSDKTYKITLKQITLNSKTSDLVFTGKAVESEVDPGEGGVVETEGTMVQATADAETQNFLGGAVNAQFMWQDISDTEIRMSFVLEGAKLSLGGEFNYLDTPVEPTFPMENYQADGKGFVVSTDIDWSKQKFQAIIDATKCNAASTEDIFGFGAEATAWFKNIHVYADKGSYKAYFQPAAWESNNNTTVTIADQSNITIEVSKAEGLTVDGVVVIAAEQLTGIFDLTTVKFGSGENSQYSNALYKSVKLVDLPKDPETGINAINAEVANGEAQLFTVNGVKLNKLQKGLNIVRTADGKVKKVLVK